MIRKISTLRNFPFSSINSSSQTCINAYTLILEKDFQIYKEEKSTTEKVLCLVGKIDSFKILLRGCWSDRRLI